MLGKGTREKVSQEIPNSTPQFRRRYFWKSRLLICALCKICTLILEYTSSMRSCQETERQQQQSATAELTPSPG